MQRNGFDRMQNRRKFHKQSGNRLILLFVSSSNLSLKSQRQYDQNPEGNCSRGIELEEYRGRGAIERGDLEDEFVTGRIGRFRARKGRKGEDLGRVGIGERNSRVLREIEEGKDGFLSLCFSRVLKVGKEREEERERFCFCY